MNRAIMDFFFFFKSHNFINKHEDKCIPKANITRKMIGRTSVEAVLAIFVCFLLLIFY